MTWQRNKDLSAWIVKFELYRVFPTFSSFSLIQSLLSRVYIIKLAKNERVTLNIYYAKNKILWISLHCLGFKII